MFHIKFNFIFLTIKHIIAGELNPPWYQFTSKGVWISHCTILPSNMSLLMTSFGRHNLILHSILSKLYCFVKDYVLMLKKSYTLILNAFILEGYKPGVSKKVYGVANLQYFRNGVNILIKHKTFIQLWPVGEIFNSTCQRNDRSNWTWMIKYVCALICYCIIKVPFDPLFFTQLYRGITLQKYGIII